MMSLSSGRWREWNARCNRKSLVSVIDVMIAKLAFCLAIPAAAGAQDAAEIIRKAVDQYEKNDRALRNYTWKSRAVARELDGKGAVKKTHTTLGETMYIGGQQYTHRLEYDGKPLAADVEKRGHEALDRAARDAEKMTPEERKAREDESYRRHSSRDPMSHVPKAYNLTIVGEPEVNGRATWEIHAIPRKEYRGQYASLFHNIEGTLWIDKEDYAWVRFDADTTDTISFGFFLARIAKGTRIFVERTRVNQEVWAPRMFSLKASARLGPMRSVNTEREVSF